MMREDEGAGCEGYERDARRTGINLLSLQCAFIPNGSDMSRAQNHLPSHCTGRGRTHEKSKTER